MSIHTQVGHIIKIQPAYGVVSVVIECDEDVCESAEFVMNKEEWLDFVAQGCAAMLKGDSE